MGIRLGIRETGARWLLIWSGLAVMGLALMLPPELGLQEGSNPCARLALWACLAAGREPKLSGMVRLGSRGLALGIRGLACPDEAGPLSSSSSLSSSEICMCWELSGERRRAAARWCGSERGGECLAGGARGDVKTSVAIALTVLIRGIG